MYDDIYVISIDFGTTYSGVAWCWSGQPDEIETVTQWPTRRHFTSDSVKVPSEICYDDSGELSPHHWGYNIPTDLEPIKWFKLLLVEEKDLASDVRNSKELRRAREQIKDLGLSPVDVVGHYLHCLWDHAIGVIKRDRGEMAIEGSRFKVWITVPAIWEDYACQRMRYAATRAGILERRIAGETTLDLIAEPEAAAVAVLNDFKGRPDVQKGDIYVVCDAGGGTVDLISYTVLSTNPLTVRECVEGKGKMCGAIFVDHAFENMLKTTLGDKWKRLSPAAKASMINTDWEFGIKRQFDDSDTKWTVTVPTEGFSSHSLKLHPYDNKKGEVPLEKGALQFRRGHIRTFFGTVTPGIRGLLHEQVKAIQEKFRKSPKAILMVGGFGSSRYLHQLLHKEFASKKIEVLQPSGARPWTAIVRGAVIRGVSETDAETTKKSRIVSRVSRYSYGTRYSARFDPGKHEDKDKYWDARELKWRAGNQMQWYLRRGEDLYTQEAVKFRWYFLSAPTDFTTPFPQTEVALYQNSELNAPRTRTHRVKHLVDISVNFDVPLLKFREFINANDQRFWSVDFEVHMASTGVDLNWEVFAFDRLQASTAVRILPDPVKDEGSRDALERLSLQSKLAG